MGMPWVRIMDEMDVIKAQMSVNKASRTLESIAAGAGMAIQYSVEECIVYLCESARKPKRMEMARLAKGWQ